MWYLNRYIISNCLAIIDLVHSLLPSKFFQFFLYNIVPIIKNCSLIFVHILIMSKYMHISLPKIVLIYNPINCDKWIHFPVFSTKLGIIYFRWKRDEVIFKLHKIKLISHISAELLFWFIFPSWLTTNFNIKKWNHSKRCLWLKYLTTAGSRHLVLIRCFMCQLDWVSGCSHS